ncbi:hypothetical protein [Bacillus sp. M6-12]|nr:hypothetical protein [Bacillus sp. M6-12]
MDNMFDNLKEKMNETVLLILVLMRSINKKLGGLSRVQKQKGDSS